MDLPPATSPAAAAPGDDGALLPFRTVLLSILGLWLCYFLLTTVRAELIDFGFTGEALWRRALACAIGVVITLALWLLLRLFDARPLPAKIAAALILSLPVSVALAHSNRLVFAPLDMRVMQREAQQRGLTVTRNQGGDLLVELPDLPAPPPPAPPPPAPNAAPEEPAAPATPATELGQVVKLPAGSLGGASWYYLVEVVFSRYFLMLAWCALYLALLTGAQARAAERREGEYRRAAKAAELRSLRYQVNPHFLFNTLNSLSALVLTGRIDPAERMIGNLSTFYRRSLADDPTADVPLRDELALQQLYLEIEAVRFPDRLCTRFDVPAELADARVPGMILQPLVENSVTHAVARVVRPVTIVIAAEVTAGERLVVSVTDDGPGPAGDAVHRGFGIGLANVGDRLAARFGAGEAQVVAEPLPGGGHRTRLYLPLQRGTGLA
ncbi:histidine kinase [Croceibacterium sp. TMG7-5b_MA50]|uniref:sensor histidine kinase n=1 Tax=Croceibacterium sp. TMG7-5b_MA50 TaxID=3121290 RepID=UPI0032217B7B